MTERERSRLFWPGVVVGWALIVAGIVGVIADAERTRPANWVRWFLGSLVVHDLLFAPAVLAGGVLLARVLPRWARAPVQGGVIVAGVLALIAAPLVRGYGMRPLNPSVQPRNYAVGLAIALGVVAALTVAELVRRAIVRRGST